MGKECMARLSRRLWGGTSLKTAAKEATESRVLVNFARSFGCRRNYSQSMKEMEYVSREGYLQEELLTELIAPGF